LIVYILIPNSTICKRKRIKGYFRKILKIWRNNIWFL